MRKYSAFEKMLGLTQRSADFGQNDASLSVLGWQGPVKVVTRSL